MRFGERFLGTNRNHYTARVAELRAMADFYGEPVHHTRLMRVITQRLGHALLGEAEGAKIATAEGQGTTLALDLIERGLSVSLQAAEAEQALTHDLQRIVTCAHETVAMAGLRTDQIDALYFTGGSTGLQALTQRLQAVFPHAAGVRGDRLASVATGLGLHAARLFA